MSDLSIDIPYKIKTDDYLNIEETDFSIQKKANCSEELRLITLSIFPNFFSEQNYHKSVPL